MVGLVIVSHSNVLANAVADLARAVSANVSLHIVATGGVGANHEELGTDASEICESITSVYSPDGVLVLADLGSAIISSRLAMEFLDSDMATHVLLCSAPLVEGAVTAAVQISIGANLEQIKIEALSALMPKQSDLKDCAITEVKAADNYQLKLSATALSFEFTVHLKNGLHARPASLFAKALFLLDATVMATNVTKQIGPKSARSINNLLMLGVLLGDTVVIHADGVDADKVIKAVSELVEQNFGESVVLPNRNIHKNKLDQHLVTLSSGIAIGHLYRERVAGKIWATTISDVQQEIARLEHAIKKVVSDLQRSVDLMNSNGRTNEAAIFEAHICLLEDAEQIDAVKYMVADEKVNVEHIYQREMLKMADEVRNLPDDYLSQRATDIQDVTSQVIRVLIGEDSGDEVLNTDGVIIAAREVTPSMLTRWGETHLKGVLTEEGGKTSHSAILANTFNVPMIAGYHIPDDVDNGVLMLLDADSQTVIIDPSQQEQGKIEAKMNDWQEQKKQNFEDSKLEAITTDKVNIAVRANVSDIDTAKLATQYCAQGVGLLRTEFMIMSTSEEPDESSQCKLLHRIFQEFPNDPVTVRLFDIGGDKPVSWLKQEYEANPFLGVRGVRVAQKEPAVFLRSIRAILCAALGYQIKIMIPMIDTIEEVEFSRNLVEKAHKELTDEGKAHLWPVEIGIMVETPSAVMMIDELAKVSDFFSIGTNDLSQYCMASERGKEDISILSTTHQPAVVRMIKQVIDVANKNNINVCVCGEMAGSPEVIKLLLGLGIRDLSMTASSIGRVKREIRNINIADAQNIAAKCLTAKSFEEICEIIS